MTDLNAEFGEILKLLESLFLLIRNQCNWTKQINLFSCGPRRKVCVLADRTYPLISLGLK